MGIVGPDVSEAVLCLLSMVHSCSITPLTSMAVCGGGSEDVKDPGETWRGGVERSFWRTPEWRLEWGTVFKVRERRGPTDEEQVRYHRGFVGFCPGQNKNQYRFHGVSSGACVHSTLVLICTLSTVGWCKS